MKKILSIILVILMLTGCAPTQQTPTEIPTEQTVAQPTTLPVAETDAPTEAVTEPSAVQLPMVAVSMPMTESFDTAEDGSVIFRQTTQSMQLTMRDPDVADKIIIDFLNRVDAHSTSAEAVRQAAQSAYSGDSAWNSYFYDLIYNPTRVDHSVLSLYGETVSFSGGNHPQRQCLAANYNMVTGEVLTLGSILYHIDSKETLAELVIESLNAIAEEKYLLDGYEDVVRKRFAVDESFDEDWYFTDEGLCFYFAPYEIAPYSSGVIIAQIPYSKLTEVIANEFFPGEEDLTDGNIQAVPLEKTDIDRFTQIAEVTVDQNGQMFFLYTTGAVRHLRIQVETANKDDTDSAASTTIFATYTLTPGDAIMLKIDTANEKQTLRLSYESGGETHHVMLTSSYLNG